ncbi:hypothetical protein BGX34_009008 [Mortierella sp. NVP85]|nr:hypothetical protein BGX34_009008 [Mortierella sp. NVP85]
MPTTSPLEITEILSHLTIFVPKSSLLSCALVSKSWYHAFNPIIWHDIVLDKKHPDPPLAIQCHRHHVKEFKIDCKKATQGYINLRFPNLASLEIEAEQESPDVTELIMQHTAITRLSIIYLDPDPKSMFWEKLLGLYNLKDLTIMFMRIDNKDIDTFWNLCTRLERLQFTRLRIPIRKSLPSQEFSHINKLLMLNFRQEEIPVLLEFMRRCPNLSFFFWDAREADNKIFISRFAQMIAEKTWPNLRHLRTLFSEVTHDNLSMITRGMQRIETIDICCSSHSLGQNLLGYLQQHFSSLTILNLRSNNSISISSVAQEILSSCPLLERLSAPPLDTIAVVNGEPWVSLRLKSLSLNFSLPPATINQVQPLLLDRLSKLTRLQELYLWNVGAFGCLSELDPKNTINLRLESGLDKLATLWSLRIIDLRDTMQRMGEQEMDWILNHWPNLNKVGGKLNAWEPDVDKTLKERLKIRGISV